MQRVGKRLFFSFWFSDGPLWSEFLKCQWSCQKEQVTMLLLYSVYPHLQYICWVFVFLMSNHFLKFIWWLIRSIRIYILPVNLKVWRIPQRLQKLSLTQYCDKPCALQRLHNLWSEDHKTGYGSTQQFYEISAVHQHYQGNVLTECCRHLGSSKGN